MAHNLGAPGPRALQCAFCLLLPLWPSEAEGVSARRVTVTDDMVVRLSTQVRHTTVLAVPAGERILEFVLGDAERWGLAGAANIALLKPMAVGAKTSVTLVTDAGRIYAFTAEEGSGDPDLMVYVRHAVPRPGRAELPAVVAAAATSAGARPGNGRGRQAANRLNPCSTTGCPPAHWSASRSWRRNAPRRSRPSARSSRTATRTPIQQGANRPPTDACWNLNSRVSRSPFP